MKLFMYLQRSFTDYYLFEHLCWTCWYWTNFFSIFIIPILVFAIDRVQIAFIVCSLWSTIKNCRIILPQTRSEFLFKSSCDNNQEKRSQKKKKTHTHTHKILLNTTRNRHNNLYVKEKCCLFWKCLCKIQF